MTDRRPDLTDAELAALEQKALFARRDGVPVETLGRDLLTLLSAYRQRGEELRQVTEERDERVKALNKRIDTLQREKPAFLTDYARMWDLLRYQRSALLDAGLITRDEYALLLSTESEHTGEYRPSPSRLESYDELAAALKAQGEELARLREALDRIANPILWLQRDADARGNEYRLDGAAAMSLASDAVYLRGIAERALAHQPREETSR